VLQITNGNLTLRESSTDLRDFLAESDDPFGKLALESRDVPLYSGGGDHASIYANFIDAVERGAPLVADGSEARMSLELANALISSSATHEEVSLPLDREAYSVLMDRLRGAL
jgi:predicted dehydrogenase